MNSCQKRLEQLLLGVDFVFNKTTKLSSSFLGRRPKILVVSKKQPMSVIDDLIKSGHRLFGENRVQEAVEKWADKKDCELHLIGPLQTNKVREAIELFDVIESLDREKLAIKISNEQKQLKIERKFFIQVNIASETQKSGVRIDEVEDFVRFCANDLQLKVTGLMCIPPKEEKPFPYFMRLKLLAKKCNLQNLSMGMSADYVEAIECGSTQIRVGSAIFNP